MTWAEIDPYGDVEPRLTIRPLYGPPAQVDVWWDGDTLGPMLIEPMMLVAARSQMGSHAVVLCADTTAIAVGVHRPDLPGILNNAPAE